MPMPAKNATRAPTSLPAPMAPVVGLTKSAQFVAGGLDKLGEASIVAIMLVFQLELLPGLLAAHYYLRTPAVDERLAALGEAGGVTLLSLAALYFAQCTLVANAFRKRSAAIANPPNQFIFQDQKTNAAVMLAEAGSPGEFNRGQRSYFNWLESLPLLAVMVAVVGPVYPHAVLRAVLGSIAARLWSALADVTDGPARMPGFMIARHVFEPFVFALGMYAGARAAGYV